MLLVASLIIPGVVSADHGDAFTNTASGRCVAVPETAGDANGRGLINAPIAPAGAGADFSTCDGGEDGVSPPYGTDNPFPPCDTIPGLANHFDPQCED